MTLSTPLSRLALVATFFLTLISTALAGDRALLNAIGYSEDGRYFAFEEFGVQDGSGFAYSNIYLIDIAEDKWVEGSPYRVRSEEEMTPLHVIRAQAASQAFADLEAYGIVTPADMIAFQADGEPEIDQTSIAFNVPGFMGPAPRDEMYEIALDIFKAPSTEPCVDYMGQEPMGFAVNLTDLDGNTDRIYEDGHIPKSRGCPITYRPTAVFMPFQSYSLDHAVLLVSVWAHGFEGPDRRFIVVPL
jgi:predicted secreted protein